MLSALILQIYSFRVLSQCMAVDQVVDIGGRRFSLDLVLSYFGCEILPVFCRPGFI